MSQPQFNSLKEFVASREVKWFDSEGRRGTYSGPMYVNNGHCEKYEAKVDK